MSNERLEYLGDSVLGTIVSDILYKRFAHKSEGFLTTIRSRIVQRESLNRIALELGLDALIVLRYKTDKKNNIFGNALEALIGAIYLDKGYKGCFRFVENRIFGSLIDIDKLLEEEINFKSRLLEWGQRHKLDITFALIGTTKNVHRKHVFQTQALVKGHIAGSGSGFSKRESQQIAAKAALEKIRHEPKFWTKISE